MSMTAEGKIVPELATRWTVSKDGLTWTFRLGLGDALDVRLRTP